MFKFLQIVLVFFCIVFCSTEKNLNKSNDTGQEESGDKVKSSVQEESSDKVKSSVQEEPSNKVKSSNIDYNLKVKELIKRSRDFFAKINVELPQANRVENIIANKGAKTEQKIAKHMDGVHAITHTRVLTLIENFFEIKRRMGTAAEQQLYKNMTASQFVERLLTRRPLVFMGAGDQYLLQDGSSGSGINSFVNVDDINTLSEYLSYDEIAIAAQISMVVPTFFINDGNRGNKGEPGAPGTFIEEGVYIASVGARFEKSDVMEHSHIKITKEQNTANNGYGFTADEKNERTQLLRVWAKFYGKRVSPSFVELVEMQKSNPQEFNKHYFVLDEESFFDKNIYHQRMRMTIEPFLHTANQLAGSEGRLAYVHAVGLGLGVWQISPEQGKELIAVYAEVLEDNDFTNISDIDFSYFPADCTDLAGVKSGSKYKNITIHFSKRNPADLIVDADKKLLVAQYAWDGNSFPGNEYWQGMLSASGDPAAASCSTISELQNPVLHPEGFSYKRLKTYGRD